ncbi:Asp-tRNA(Asn)/Glu-tRNA(Gln) amidotransferase subunit GatC [Candidatus Neptunichlamydia sp. REUL1]|uniref:Asp-tRNA(Asn)/Glu-tRNA(Gln) amidotransferase subunit GatC n=1 Tax=Candidatus Neptunichlamydia sp. REUL1 TaxID=3064277 RepID=UPI00292F72A1|nr:Asp-tRNA(Asn)/Glu-tRNA(Gln) amidotransferase subunit GatC [Candidatus Neptunochlamydia sp. REUL1]
MTKLDKETLIDLTKLCRINCSEEELETLLNNLQSILGYIDQMEEVDTEGVPVCNHVSEEMESVTREDEPDQSLDRKTFLDNSPSHVGGMIRVPTVIKF